MEPGDEESAIPGETAAMPLPGTEEAEADVDPATAEETDVGADPIADETGDAPPEAETMSEDPQAQEGEAASEEASGGVDAMDDGSDVAPEPEQEPPAEDGTATEDGAAEEPEVVEGDTWENFAMEFFVGYCSPCHDDGGSGAGGGLYYNMEDVIEDADPIACGVTLSEQYREERGCNYGRSAGQFPAGAGPKPTDEERERLVAWIDAGMP
jgi:hypothetical protein